VRPKSQLQQNCKSAGYRHLRPTKKAIVLAAMSPTLLPSVSTANSNGRTNSNISKPMEKAKNVTQLVLLNRPNNSQMRKYEIV
jgi:hypothetical protein